jgi:catechol 2,3-dioxygenase-like lactoylglutathione lyase family enzyme
MPVPARINIVTLGVGDLKKSTAFYKALGWKLSSSSNDQISFFKTAGGVLALYPYDLLAEDARLPAVARSAFGGVTLAINVETPEQVQPALDAAVAAGGRILKNAIKAGWGGVSGYFSYPDGYP